MIDARRYPSVVPLQTSAVTQLRRIGLPLEANRVQQAYSLHEVCDVLDDVDDFVWKTREIVASSCGGLVAALLGYRMKEALRAIRSLKLEAERQLEREFEQVWGTP